MDWTLFKTHGDSSDRAFEAFTGLLFERWCRCEYQSRFEQTIFVNGTGGDGGVEVYTLLSGRELIGLQCKWFRTPLEDSQFRQIRESLDTAVRARLGLRRYIIAIPRELSDRGLARRAERTERTRWETFRKSAVSTYPQVEIELWDEARLVELLGELGSEGLERYWFDRTIVSIQNLQLRFVQARQGWLRGRYSPDIHQQGKINADLYIRLSKPSNQQTWLIETRKCIQQLNDGRKAVNRLKRLRECVHHHDLDKLIDSSLSWFDQAIIEEMEIKRLIEYGQSFPILQVDYQPIHIPREIFDLLQVLENPNRTTWHSSPTEPIYKELKLVTELWAGRTVTFDFLRQYGQPVAYIGEPGSGKTHALVKAVEEHLSNGMPAVLIRARDLAIISDWGSILASAMGEQGWTLPQLLDALEAAAIQATIRNLARTDRNNQLSECRALIAVDGLDETPHSELWQEKIGEIIPLSFKWPRVLFAFSLRTSLTNRIQLHPDIDQIHIQESDVSLPTLFQAYCRASHIVCPPLLRWALRTPLSIKLFADLYEGCDLANFAAHEFSLERLIAKKLEHVERALLNAELANLRNTIRPMRVVMRTVMRLCLKLGRAVSGEEALQAIEDSLSPKYLLNRIQLLEVMHHCSDNGLLLKTITAATSPLEDDIIQWELTYQIITDYLLACDVVDAIARDGISRRLPEYLVNHRNAIQLAVSMLGKEYRFFESMLWADSLDTFEREAIQLTALVSMSPQVIENYREWVSTIFVRNMPTCRLVLDKLIVPSLRLRECSFGAKFVHEQLLSWRVADRDLFWSGPNYLPHNHGGKWEGYGEPILETLSIEDDDPWDSAPLLLAWATTNVNNENRRRIRTELAQWGRNKPENLLLLLQTTIDTNDPQMKEDILLATYGAACLTRPDQSWEPLCRWLIRGHFGKKDDRLQTYDVVFRHAIYGIVERSLVCGVQLSEEEVTIYQNQQISNGDLLPLDQEAVKTFHEHHGVKPAKGDLAWYVVPNAIAPFFKESFESWSNFEEPQATSPTYTDIDVEILRGVIEGKLRPNVDEKTREQISSVLSILEGIAASTEQDLDQWLANMPYLVTIATSDEEHSSEILENTGTKPEQEVQQNSILNLIDKLLEEYRVAYHLTKLKSGQFAFGFVAAFAKGMGWTEAVFEGQPNGDKPGEIIGPDIAIIRQYGWARHGARSNISSFAEKYVWTAVEYLTGYLAEHLPAYLNNQKINPPILPMLLADITNSAADVCFNKPVLDFSAQLNLLLPTVELHHTNQIDLANAWVELAPLPNFARLLAPQREDMPSQLAEHDWLVLRLYADAIDENSQAKTAIEASALTLPFDALDLISQDVQFGKLQNFHDFHQSVDRIETYIDPSEVVWASWYRESHGSHTHLTLDESGNPTAIKLQAASSSFYWDSPNGERQEWIPSEWLRKALKIVDYRDGQFLNSSNEIVAYFIDIRNEDQIPFRYQGLYVLRDLIVKAMEQNQQTMIWGLGCWREPSSPLYQKGWPIVRLSWNGLSLRLSEGNIATFTQSTDIQRAVVRD